MPRKNRPPKGQNPHREGAGRPRGPNGRGAAFKRLRELARSHVNIMRKSKDDWLCLACANPARRFDRRFGTRGRAEFAARVVGVKIDRARRRGRQNITDGGQSLLIGRRRAAFFLARMLPAPILFGFRVAAGAF